MARNTETGAVMTDLDSVLTQRIVVVTGGTGTFGSAAVHRFLSAGVAEVRILSRDEKKQDDMRRTLREPRVRFFIGDVRDRESLREPMAGADLVFHAAALKQVPSCEFHPVEAVRTNILGTDNVLAVAQDASVQRVVVLSTDKAAYPINAMGMSKALMEKVAAARARTAAPGTTICITRYGNVLASRGSVVPLFIDQISRGLPLTVTDPTMTRFLMTVGEAVELVLFAMVHGNPGDLFVHKAPAAEIGVLAEAVLSLFPDHDAGVQVIGTRHGEKLFETLLTREEMVRADDLGKFFRVPADSRDMNYDQFFVKGEHVGEAVTEFNSHTARRLGQTEVAELIGTVGIVNGAFGGAGTGR